MIKQYAIAKCETHRSLCSTKRKLRVKVILLWKVRSQCNFVYSALKDADRYIGVTFVARRYRVTLTSRITYIYLSVVVRHSIKRIILSGLHARRSLCAPIVRFESTVCEIDRVSPARIDVLRESKGVVRKFLLTQNQEYNKKNKIIKSRDIAYI